MDCTRLNVTRVGTLSSSRHDVTYSLLLQHGPYLKSLTLSHCISTLNIIIRMQNFSAMTPVTRQAQMPAKMKASILYISSRQTSYPISILSSTSSDPYFRNDECDRYDIAITYCGFSLNCQVIYDFLSPDSPPDLIFPQIEDFYPTIQQVYGKEEWDSKDETNLWKVICRIRDLYATHEKRRVEHFLVERIKSEYESLKHIPDLECRISLEKASSRPVVMFRIPLNINVQNEEDEDEDNKEILKAHIFVELHISQIVLSDHQFDNEDARITSVQTRLELPPELEAKRNAIEIPQLEKDMMLGRYIGLVKDILQEVVISFKEGAEKKKRFFHAMCLMFRQNLLECDTVEYSYMSFYIEVKTPQDIYDVAMKESTITPDSLCPAVVNVHIGPNFPKEPPNIVITSPILFKSPTNYKPESKFVDIPQYSARWAADRIVHTIRSRLIETIPRLHFQLPEKFSLTAAIRNFPKSTGYLSNN